MSIGANVASIGTDVEVFVRNKETGVIASSASLFMMGNVSKKYAKTVMRDRGAANIPCAWYKYHPDNIALEWSTPVVTEPAQWGTWIQGIVDDLSKKVASEGHEIVPFMTESLFSIEQLSVMRNSKEGGCDADINIYTNKFTPFDPITNLWRFCGGHIHVGFTKKPFTTKDIGDAVNKLDKGLGFYLQELCKKFGQTERMKYYGRLGTIREKSYGFEYRTPSNLWVFDPESIQRVLQYVSEL